MANTLSPFGLLPEAAADGSSPTYGLRNWKILYSNNTKIYRGDPVKIVGGYIQQWTAATVVSQLAGIFWGCKYYSQSQQQMTWSKYWPGSGDVATNANVTAFIIPVSTATPPQFVVQTGNSNTTATAFSQADIGKNYDVALGTGSTASGMSGAYLDQNTYATTATLPFRVVNLWSQVQPGGPGSDDASANNWVVVQANIYQETGI